MTTTPETHQKRLDKLEREEENTKRLIVRWTLIVIFLTLLGIVSAYFLVQIDEYRVYGQSPTTIFFFIGLIVVVATVFHGKAW